METDKIKKVERLYCGIQWYKAKPDSGIYTYLEQLRNGDENLYMVHRSHPKYGRYYGIANKLQIEKMISKNVYLYEILISSIRKKVYFDIDIEDKKDKLEECLKIINDNFPEANIQVSGSKTEEKISYHIVLSNYYVYDTIILEKFVEQYKSLGFDTNVYKKKTLFKCINQSKTKENSPIQAYISGNKKLTKHLVLMDFDTDAKNIEELSTMKVLLNNVRETSNRNKLNETQIDLLNINEMDIKHELPETFDYINACALEKLKAIPLNHRKTNNTLNHLVIWKIMVWAKNENITFEDFWNWCKQKDSTESRKLRYISYYQTASKYNIPEKFIDTLLLKFYPYLKEDNIQKLYRKMNEINATKEVDSNYLQHSDISLNTKVSYLNVRMGGNKTGAVIDYIKTNYKEKRVLYIVPRISLATDIKERMIKENVNFELYSDILTKDSMGEFDNLIVCINSLIYLADCKYSLIVIDEIETIWESFSNGAKLLGYKASSIWYLLGRLLKDADKIIVMDALMSMKTINTINQMTNINNESVEIVKLTNGQEPRKYIKYNSKDISGWFDSIKQSILNGEKVFVFMPYKTTYAHTKRDKRTGVQTLVNYLCETCNLIENEDIIGYYSEQKEQKSMLKDINKIWEKAKCIVANTCISVGNNYSGKDFSKIYIYFSNWVVSRELIQIMYRIRSPIENTMHIYFEKKNLLLDRYKTHTLELEDDAFKILKDGLILEDRTDPLTRMHILSKRCNITLDSEAPETDIKEELDMSSFLISYDKVHDLLDCEFIQIKNNIQNGFVSLLERLKYEKYLLKKKFKEDTPDNIISTFWPCPLLINQLKKLNEYNIINKILDGNGHPDFITFVENHSITDLSILHIPNHITNDMIKELIYLRDGINDRGVYLVSRVINSYFNKRIMYPIKKITRDEKTKEIKDKYKRIYVSSLEKNVIEYEINFDFVYKIMIYKEHIKNKKEESMDEVLIEEYIESDIEE